MEDTAHLVPKMVRIGKHTISIGTYSRNRVNIQSFGCLILVKRFVDRDMLVRFMGLGVGHLRPLKAREAERFPVPEESEYPQGSFTVLDSTDQTGGQDEEDDEIDVEEMEEEELRAFEDDLTEEGFPDLVELLSGL